MVDRAATPGGTDVTLAADQPLRLSHDRELRDRAAKVIPGGMYGHMTASAKRLPPSFPQFWTRGVGALAWGADGNRHLDFMCAFAPMLLGCAAPIVSAAIARPAALAG